MNLQAKRSVFRARKAKRPSNVDRATTFLGERLRIYNERMSVRRARRGH